MNRLRAMVSCGFLLLILGACAANPAAAVRVSADNPRLQRAMAKLRRGEAVSVVAFGGSITTGYQARPPATEGWAGQVNRWWQEKAQASGGAVNFRNSGASGTDSAFASIRVQDHVLAYEPDVVFVEFAINDQWLSSKVRRRSYEGVLRQLLDNSERAVILLALNEKANPNKSARADQKPLGDHYGLPTLAWADWVKLADWDLYFTGSEAIHPNNEGHANIAWGIKNYLDAVWNSLPAGGDIPPVDTALPPPLVSAEFQKAVLIGGDDTAALAGDLPSSGWQTQQAILPDEWRSRGGGPLTGWTTADPAADLRIKVRGKSVGLLFTESDQYRDGLAWVEEPGDPAAAPQKVTVKTFVSYRSGYYGYAYAEIAGGLDPAKDYILRLGVGSGGKAGGATNVVGVIVTQ